MMRIATDMGGTFTDLIVERGDSGVRLYKSPTTPNEPLVGVFNAIQLAADDFGQTMSELLAGTDTFVHGTTRSLNAVVTGQTARTALLTTEGHPDILLFREGGRGAPFDFTRSYPRPWVPRDRTFEVPGRIAADGSEVRPLDEEAVKTIVERLREGEIEAVAVCLLWSVVNPAHEARVGELLAELAPGLPVTLSHEINPIVREYRRACSTVLDASLKPLMGAYLRALQGSLESRGFRGRLLINTSAGGVQDALDVAAAPIHTINSGPAMAPVAGRYYAGRDAGNAVAIVADTGGTTYDVSVVRDGRIPVTQEAWIGERHAGQLTGFPGVDIRSVGAGGGSIAWVDAGGMLRVGPQSAGSEPGPVCYSRGGTEPTVTDACLALGYLDGDYFLGGRMKLDVEGARRAVTRISGALGLTVEEAAAAILELATEHMVGAIEEITLNQGISAQDAVLVGGGGAAGFNAVAIARRLGCDTVVVPALGAVLSAAGALMSDLSAEWARTLRTSTDDFTYDDVNAVLAELQGECAAFADGPGANAISTTVELVAEARYPSQVWELEVPLRVATFAERADVEQLRSDFHRVHREIFAIDDSRSPVEIVGWRARVRCRMHDRGLLPDASGSADRALAHRPVYLRALGAVDVPVVPLALLSTTDPVPGPLIVESPVTTIVVNPGASAVRTATGSVLVRLDKSVPSPTRARR
ncbi:N-methylhydantoinase A [Prauserella muralis]|nr:N-methylhydantoinase A [Prauserella muralis]